MATKRTIGRTSVAAICAAGVRDPAPSGTYSLVTFKGPGAFLGAKVTKQGGTGDLTFFGSRYRRAQRPCQRHPRRHLTSQGLCRQSALATWRRYTCVNAAIKGAKCS
jgi:hypothetical protein